MPHFRLMQVDEIDAIAREFVKLGVKKIRLTGGEPLVRKDFSEIVSVLSKYPIELTLTTNGLRTNEFIDVFK
jgi:cyclic pyranopterin phosphate synthase